MGSTHKHESDVEIMFDQDLGPDAAGDFQKTLLESLQRPHKVKVVFNAPAGYSASTLERVFGGLSGLIGGAGEGKQYLAQHLELVPSHPIYNDYVALARRYLNETDEKTIDFTAGAAA